MAVAFRAAGALGSNASGDPTVSYPAGVVSGDLLVIQYTSATATVPNTPAGWTKLFGGTAMAGGSGHLAYVFYKIAGASEPSSVAFTHTGSNGQSAGIMSAYSGADPVTPIDVFTTALLPTSGTSGTTPSVTTTKANTKLLRMYWNYSNTATITPAGTDTERYDVFFAAPFIGLEMADSDQAAAGASGTTTATYNVATSGGLGATIAVAPPAAVSPPRPIRVNTSAGWVDIADSSNFVSGSGAPTAAVGANGAIYLDTASGRMYGPKAADAWPGAPLTTPADPDATTSVKGLVQLAGDLAGTAASPQIAAGVITDAEVATANKDGAAGTASLRTLGTGAQQAMPGQRWMRAEGDGLADGSTAALNAWTTTKAPSVTMSGAGWRRVRVGGTFAAAAVPLTIEVSILFDGAVLLNRPIVAHTALALYSDFFEWTHLVGSGSHTWQIGYLVGASTGYLINRGGSKQVPYITVEEAVAPS